MMIFKRQIPKKFKVSLKQNSDKDNLWDQILMHSLSRCHESLYSGDTDQTDNLCPQGVHTVLRGYSPHILVRVLELRQSSRTTEGDLIQSGNQ